MQCTSCGAVLRQEDRFCEECGQPVAHSDASRSARTERSSDSMERSADSVDRSHDAIELSRREFKRLLSRVHAAMGPADRPALNGMRFIVDAHVLTLVATDGHRLAMATNRVDGGPTGRCELTVARATIEQLIGFLNEDDEPAIVELSTGHATFRLGERTLASHAVGEPFPDYMRLFPSGQASVLRVDREHLQSALQRVAPDTGALPRTLWTLGAGRLSLEGSDGEQTQESLHVAYAGPPLRIGLNALYVIEALRSLDSHEVEIAIVGPLSPIVLRMPAREDVKWVLMPMKI